MVMDVCVTFNHEFKRGYDIYHTYKKNLIFIPNRKVSSPNYSSVFREGKSLDLLISARQRRSLRLRFNPTRIPWTGDGVSCVKEFRKVEIGRKKEKTKIKNEHKNKMKKVCHLFL